jgi:hypothetical protein
MADTETHRERLVATTTDGPRGLGGWLLLVGLGLVTAIIFGLRINLELGANLDLANRLGGGIGAFLFVETLGNLLFFMFNIVATLLYFQRSRHFPIAFVFLTVAGGIYLLAELVVAWSYFRSYFGVDNPLLDRDTLREVGRSIFGVCVWVPYMLVSVRVKNTFVK